MSVDCEAAELSPWYMKTIDSSAVGLELLRYLQLNIEAFSSVISMKSMATWRPGHSGY